MADPVVASLQDSLVRESDLALLDGPFWLNDCVIGFYFEHLFQSHFQGSNKVCFISPEVSQFLKLVSDDEIRMFVEPLNLEAKQVILMAVNNASDPSRPGGSHWSLLIYSAQARMFYHLDSSPGMNESHAKSTAKKIHSFLVKKERESGVNLFFDFIFKEVDVLKQSNGYDCGIHVLLNAENAARHFMVYGGPDGLDSVDPVSVKDMRAKVKSVICQYPSTAANSGNS